MQRGSRQVLKFCENKTTQIVWFTTGKKYNKMTSQLTCIVPGEQDSSIPRVSSLLIHHQKNHFLMQKKCISPKLRYNRSK